MNQDSIDEFYYENCIVQTHQIVFLIESKYYRVYFQDTLITVSDLMKFLSLKLYEVGLVINPDQSKYIDAHGYQIFDYDPVKNFIHKIKYIKVIELEKGKRYSHSQHIHDNEIEYFLTKYLNSNERKCLRTIQELRMLGKDQPFLAYPLRDALHSIHILILGPIDSPYQGGVFEMVWSFEDSHSTKNMITPIYHPNVQKGKIIFEQFLKPSHPGQSFLYSLYYFIYMLGSPDITDEFTNAKYINRACLLTQKYANPTLYEQSNVQMKDSKSNFDDLMKTSETFFSSQKWRDFLLSSKDFRSLKKKYNNTHLNIPQRRLLNEFYRYQTYDQTEILKIFPINNEFNRFRIIFIGPKNTHFENGIYQLDLNLPENYPALPPICQLKTQIYHPNIKGERISIDILNEMEWSQALTIEAITLSIISILDDPNPDDPLDIECAQLYINDRESYNKRVVEYKLKYASPSINELIDNILELDAQKDKDRNYLENILNEWIQYWKAFQI